MCVFDCIQSFEQQTLKSDCHDRASEKLETFAQTWGIPWDQYQFVQKAVSVGHPCRLAACVPKQLEDVVEVHAKTSSADRVKNRAARLAFWVERLNGINSLENRSLN